MKTFLKQLLQRLGILDALRNFVRGNPRQGVDPRRFWNGEVVQTPDGNVPLFEALHKASVTITHKNESRDAVIFEQGEKITITFFRKHPARLKIGCGFDIVEAAQAHLAVRYNGEPHSLTMESAHQWHDLRIDLATGHSVVEIHNPTKFPLTLSHPIVEEIFTHSNASHPELQNIIVLVLDSLYRDVIGQYNPEMVPYTPNISRFFKDAHIYTNAYVQSEWTFPSMYSYLTGRSPFEHGMYDLRNSPPDVARFNKDFISRYLKNEGFSTIAYSTAKIFQPAFNAHIGFDRFFYDFFPQDHQTHAQICDQALKQLSANHDGKNFLLLHFLDSHEPWSNPDEFDAELLAEPRFTNPSEEYAFYRRGNGDTKAEPIFDDEGIAVLNKRRNARLHAMDISLQRLFDYLERTGQHKHTAVIFTSDHGYAYMQKTAPLLCNTRVNVPMLIRTPHLKGKKHTELVAANLDLARTIRSLVEGTFTGRFGASPRDYVISESTFGDLYKVAVRDTTHVLHMTFEYDLKRKKICLDRMKKQMLFSRKNEELCIDISLEEKAKVDKLHTILVQHIRRNSADIL